MTENKNIDETIAEMKAILQKENSDSVANSFEKLAKSQVEIDNIPGVNIVFSFMKIFKE